MNNFEELCGFRVTPLDPKEVVVEFLKSRPKVFVDILKTKNNLYKELLDILLEREDDNLKEFIHWYRDYLYNY